MIVSSGRISSGSILQVIAPGHRVSFHSSHLPSSFLLDQILSGCTLLNSSYLSGSNTFRALSFILSSFRVYSLLFLLGCIAGSQSEWSPCIFLVVSSFRLFLLSHILLGRFLLTR